MTIPLPHTLSPKATCKAFEPALKIGMLATVTPEGLPHLTLISSLKAGTPHHGVVGPVHRGQQQVNSSRIPTPAS